MCLDIIGSNFISLLEVLAQYLSEIVVAMEHKR